MNSKTTYDRSPEEIESEKRENILNKELDKTIGYLSQINMKQFLRGYKNQKKLILGSGFISRILYEMLNSFIFKEVDNFIWEERKKLMWERKYVFNVLYNSILWSIHEYYNGENRNAKIWELIENNLIPALEHIFWDRENLLKEELFYLRRDNKIKA